MMPTSDGKNVSDPQLPVEVAQEGKGAGSLVPVMAFPHPVLRPDMEPPAAVAGAPNALALLRALRRRLLPALILGVLLSAGAGSAMWFLLPQPKKIARASLYVPSERNNLFEVKLMGGDTFLRNQAVLIKDIFVLNRALNAEGLTNLEIIKEQPDPRQWLENEIKVEFPSSEYIQITLSGDRPEEMLQVVRAVRKTYLDEFINKEAKEREVLLETTKNLYEQFSKRSKQLRVNLRKLQEEGGVVNPDNVAQLTKMFLEDMERVRKDLVAVHSEISSLQAELGLHPDWLNKTWLPYTAALTSLPGPSLPLNFAFIGLIHDEFLCAGLPNGEDFEEILLKDPVVGPMLARIQQLEYMIEQIRVKARPKVFKERSKPLQDEVQALKTGVTEYIKKKGPKWIKEMRERAQRNGEGGRATSLRYRYSLALERQRLLQEEFDRLSEKTASKNKMALDLSELKDEIAKYDSLMNKTSNRITALEAEQNAPARVREFGEGSIFTPDAAKRKILFTMGAAGGAMMLVLLAFALLEFHSRKVQTPEEVVQGLGLPLVGTVPDLSQRVWLKWLRPGAVDTAYTQSLLTESVDTARTVVLHSARTEKLQVIMITSALAGEGKTSLASHLAASLARVGRRTLLLDSDLRNPSMHRLFDMTRGPGLSEVLRGVAELPATIRETPIPNLWLISAGQFDPVAVQTLALDNMRQIFDQLRSQYDFILVDSCPVLPVADSLLVSQHVDAVIFSLLRQISRLPRVHAAYQRLATLGVRILGAVVNGTEHDTYGAGYNYHYVSTEE